MKIIAHRGARGLAPENTLAAINKALELGADEIEIDVRVTSDNVIVLSHDDNLKRLTGKDMPIAKHSYAELVDTKPDLCTLEDAIRVVNQRVPLLIEVKPNVKIDPITELLWNMLSQGWRADHFLLGSFSQDTLLGLHTALPEISKVVIESWNAGKARNRADQVGANRLNMNQRYMWYGIATGIHKDYELYPYTLNDPVKAKRWAKRGLAGIITDFPDRFKTDPK